MYTQVLQGAKVTYLFFWRAVSNVDAMASRRPLSARNVDHTQGRGKPKKERHPFALLDRATLVQNLRHLTKDSSFPVNVCEDDLLKPAVSVVTLIMVCSSRAIVKLSWKYTVVCPFGMSSIYKSQIFSSLQLQNWVHREIWTLHHGGRHARF